jgi:hypothetical protein
MWWWCHGCEKCVCGCRSLKKAEHCARPFRKAYSTNMRSWWRQCEVRAFLQGDYDENWWKFDIFSCNISSFWEERGLRTWKHLTVFLVFFYKPILFLSLKKNEIPSWLMSPPIQLTSYPYTLIHLIINKSNIHSKYILQTFDTWSLLMGYRSQSLK